MSEAARFATGALPEGIRSRFVDDVNGLRMHILEAGFEPQGRPCVLLLHGFPEGHGVRNIERVDQGLRENRHGVGEVNAGDLV